MPGKAQPHEAAKIERYVLEGFDGGLHSEGAFSKVHISDTECTCAENIEFWPVGTITKRKGRSYKNLGDQLSGAITQVYQWWSEAGANYLLVFTAACAVSGTPPAAMGTPISGGVYYYLPAAGTSGTFVPILSAGRVAADVDGWTPTLDEDIRVETFGGSAIWTDGKDAIYSYSGTTCCAIDDAPVGAVCIKGYKNYLFVGNCEEPNGGGNRHLSRIYWSNPADANVWPATNYLDLDGDDGDLITGMDVLGNELIVFKERKIFAITYVGGVYEFLAESRANGVGCAAGGSIVPIFNELLFYGTESFYSFNGREVESLSDKLKDIITANINPTYRDKIQGLTYEDKDQAWFLTPITQTASGNSHCLILDYERDSWTIFSNPAACLSWYTKSTDTTFGDLVAAYETYDVTWGARSFDSNSAQIITGTYDGYLLDNGTIGLTDDLGSDYEGFWRSRWLDFGMPDINKRITRMTILVDKEAASLATSYNLNVKIYKDWDQSAPAYTKTVAMYGSYPVLERRLDFTMSCRVMQIEIGTTKKAQSFTIHKIIIEYLPKGRTIV